MMLRTWFLILPLTFLLIGCDSGRSPISESREGVASTAPPLRATLWSAHGHYRENEPVELRFTLENLSDEEVVLESDNEPVMDILFLDEGWHWSEGPGLGQDLTRLVLAPKAKHTITWHLPPLPADGYHIFGVWQSRNGEVRLTFCHGQTLCSP